MSKPVRYKYNTKFQFEMLSLLVAPSFSYLLNFVEPGFFDLDEHRDICDAIKKFTALYQSPPTRLTLQAQLEKNGKNSNGTNIERLYDDRLSADQEFTRDAILDFAKDQRVKAALTEAIDLLHQSDNEQRHREILEKIQKAVQGENSQDLGTRLFGDIERRVYFRDEELGEPIATLWREVDEKLGGGVFPKTMSVLLAGTNVGKSVALVNLGVAAVAQGKTVFHYTLEMSRERTLARYDARLSGKGIEEVIRGRIEEEIIGSLRKIQGLFGGEVLVKDYPPNSATVEDIRAHVDRVELELGMKPDMIIVDYGDILKHHIYKEFRHQVATSFVNLRKLAVDLDTRLWTATQTNRKGLTRDTPELADVAEDIEKIRISDTVLILCQTDEEEENGLMRVLGAKIRDQARKWEVTIRTDIKKMFLGNVIEPEYFQTPQRGGEDA